jgi:hypothetical protein
LDLAQPDFAGMENVHLGGDLDLIGQPGVHTSIFTSADPIVHNRVFGLARLDLATRQVNYDPIGPAPSGHGRPAGHAGQEAGLHHRRQRGVWK